MAGTQTLDPVIMEYVERQIDEILRARGGLTFTAEHADRLDALEASVGVMQGDKSLGRIFNGPLWLSGASVLDGTITAAKISVTTLEAVQASTGTLNVTGTITLAASYPALTGARITLDAGEIAGYNSSDAKTFSLDVDGSGFIGIGSSKVSWTTAGVVTVPVAAISALTIAEVGSGTFNSNFDAGTGRVRAGTALQRVELTSAGIAAYNTGGTQTFLLDATTGSLSHTGTYTIRSAASGTRIEVTNVGIRGYNGATQTFELLASNGSGFLGSSPQITWGAGSLSIPGGSITASSITASQMNVSTLSSITANMGTITAGSITAGTVSASTITTGSLNGALLSSSSVSDSAIGSMAVSKLTTGSVASATITLSSSGSLQWASGGSSISSSRMTLTSSGDGSSSAIEFKTSGTTRGYLWSTSTLLGLGYTASSGGLFTATSTVASVHAGGTFGPTITLNGSADTVSMQSGGSETLLLDASGRTIATGNIFPQNQTNDYLGHNGSDIGFGGLTTAAGAGSLVGYFQLSVNGTSYKVPYYNLA